jgi:hypothetical protein
MSIITDLYATLNTNAGVRAIVGEATSPQQSKIYPGHAPESASVPLITYFLVAGSRIDTLPGVSDMESQLIQLSCVDTTPELAMALGDAVFAALEGNGYIRNVGGPIYDSTTQTYMVPIDWAFLA